MRTRIYIGQADGKRTIFRSATEPTFQSHPQYVAVIGPFRTVRAAAWMSDPVRGQSNPHCRCVADAERLASKYKNEYNPKTRTFTPLP